jgi:hypothetical protein
MFDASTTSTAKAASATCARGVRTSYGLWRRVVATERRTKREFAQAVRYLSEGAYPDAEKICLVLDNLSTHSPAAFYETFAPELARPLARKIEFCCTPVDGSWLNMVEVEI